MGKFQDEARQFNSLCADCGHNQAIHSKATYRDEQRQTMSSTKQIPSECQEKNCTCQRFRPPI